MRKFLFPGLVGLLMLILAACGSSATAVPEAKQAPAAAAQPAAPAAAVQPAAPAAVAAPAVPSALAAYAAKHAGGVGAIYVGDLKQLAGPAPTKDQGDFDGNVTLDSLERYLYVYESDYYKSLLEKAKLTNPTPLVSTGQNITIQHACINRALLFCKLVDGVMFPNVLTRTNGQLKLVTSSFPELGVAGPDTLRLISDGTLAMAEMVPAYIGGDLPAIDITYLLSLYPNREAQINVFFALIPDIEKLYVEATGGGKVVFRTWAFAADIYFFSKKALRSPDDFKGMKVRSPGTAFSDLAGGLGAEAQFVAFSEVYTALERGILDAGVSGAQGGWSQRWYEVVKYLNGPLYNMEAFNVIMNKDVWSKLPPDLQQILIEEGAKSELEALRLAPTQNDMAVLMNTAKGMEYVEFSPEITDRIKAVMSERVLANWIKRVGGGDKPIIKVFNEHSGPRVGLRIEPDGSVTKVPITKTGY